MDPATIVQVEDVNHKPKYKKPLRPCVFCRKFQSRLTRHILARQKTEPQVTQTKDLQKQEKFHVFQN